MPVRLIQHRYLSPKHLCAFADLGRPQRARITGQTTDQDLVALQHLASQRAARPDFGIIRVCQYC